MATATAKTSDHPEPWLVAAVKGKPMTTKTEAVEMTDADQEFARRIAVLRAQWRRQDAELERAQKACAQYEADRYKADMEARATVPDKCGIVGLKDDAKLTEAWNKVAERFEGRRQKVSADLVAARAAEQDSAYLRKMLADFETALAQRELRAERAAEGRCPECGYVDALKNYRLYRGQAAGLEQCSGCRLDFAGYLARNLYLKPYLQSA